jgi:hypothetical protein
MKLQILKKLKPTKIHKLQKLKIIKTQTSKYSEPPKIQNQSIVEIKFNNEHKDPHKHSSQIKNIPNPKWVSL